ncbi:conserved hypothetical protein [Sodalis glossinidius str. 'morsitans']|uniref:DnaJ homologue subfamily C member 28 conserved domain-containing protein n=1 Tax=Sodalis glossinidius (strain morsitans) TaxID=343509 RepID=Q2NQP9_SODGM|nr:DnaJ family domain-containing protein [Sodalis glossinidius]BAE75526.1 conserved hypothetical protein [Sodalis glossinidius str. 'morsitans']
MGLIDDWAERHIQQAQQAGEFDALPGHGKPLQLDDDSAVPAELQDRKDALQLADLLKTLDEDDPLVAPLDARLWLLDMKLRQAGMSTGFLHQHYQRQLRARFIRSGRS